MSTKTMRPPPRRVSWASPITTKREDGLEKPKKVPSTTTTTTTTTTTPMTKLLKLDKSKAGSKPMNPNNKGSKPMSYDNKGSSSKGKNHLLAGYFAHEYLTKGTLMGKRWDQLPSQRVEPKQEEKHQMYVEVAHLFKTNGTQVDNVVNPTQLARTLGLL